MCGNRQWRRVHFKWIFTISTRMTNTSSVYMCQYDTTKWCSKKEELTSCRDVSKYVTCKECTWQILGRVYRTMTHIINKLPKAKLGFISPFEKIWDSKLVVGHFRVFGCVCYVFVPSHLCSKFEKSNLMYLCGIQQLVVSLDCTKFKILLITNKLV